MRQWFDTVLSEYENTRSGVLFLKNGDMYDGELNELDVPNGRGTYTTRSGTKFEGTFHDGEFQLAE
jgi:hypothetical protein